MKIDKGTMIRNYLKTTLRHLWRNRLFTALNVLGLAIGISACWIIYRIVHYEFSYEHKLPGKEDIYRLVSSLRINDGKESLSGGVSKPIYQGVRDEVTSLKRVVPVYSQWFHTVETREDGAKPVLVEEPSDVVATDSAYFDMVPYTWLAGNKQTAFSAPGNVVLTESRARVYFPDIDVSELVGKTLFYNDSVRKTVSGVVKDLDYPTEFTAKEFVYQKPLAYTLDEWTNTSGSDRLYLQMRAADTAKVLSQVRALVDGKWQAFKAETRPAYTFEREFFLIPLKEMHFATHVNEYQVRKASKSVLFGLMGIGAFLLLLACINYINLSTAQLPQRAKEIGVRKTFGSSRAFLIGQLLCETTMMVLLATILAGLLSQLGFTLLGSIIPDGALDYPVGGDFLVFLTVMAITVIALAGWYPSRLMSRVKPVNIFRKRGLSAVSNSPFNLRKSLIVFQFVIAQVFIVGALIMGQQLSYTLRKDMGFDKEAVILFSVPHKLTWHETYRDRQFTLADELRRETGIEAVSLGKEPLSAGYASSPFVYKGDESDPRMHQLPMKWIDTAYIPLYGIELIAGRNLRPSDTINEYVINETAVKTFGFASPQEAIGKTLSRLGKQGFPIVGVVRDFHMKDFYTEMEPAILMTEKSNLSTFNVKLNTEDPAQWQKTLKTIEEKWYRFYPPGTFSYKFYDETLEALYTQERNLAKLINIATTIAIVISCLGLFGLVTLTAFQRTKEIGIRKVLGATVTGIVAMLSKDFVKLVLIAAAIASPIAWWAMNRWLEGFAYHIDIQWWMFAAAGSAAVVIALLTVSWQAIRAAMANPVESLRDE